MRKTILTTVVMFLAAVSFAFDCDKTINDDAGVLGSKQDQVSIAAGGLTAQGADVRVLAVNLEGRAVTMDKMVDDMRKVCPSWQSPNGSTKSTLVVIAVAPKERKMGIFYGASMANAFNGQADRIRSQYMGPHFKNAEWAEGLIAAEQQLALRLAASHDEALHPAVSTTTTNVAASDYSWLGNAFKWFLFLGGFAGLIYLVMYIAKSRRTKEAERIQAQLNARSAYSQAIDLLTSMADKFSTDSTFINQQDKFTRFANQMSYDPSDNARTTEEYSMMTDLYTGIYKSLQRLQNGEVSPSATGGAWRDELKKPTHKAKKSTPVTPRETTRETVVVHDNSNDFTTGVVLGSLLNDRREREPEPEHHYRRDPDPEPEPERHSSFGGGSSDYSSSSSSSSSDFGGGSSGFDSSSGSSDSGSSGGGSSDF